MLEYDEWLTESNKIPFNANAEKIRQEIQHAGFSKSLYYQCNEEICRDKHALETWLSVVSESPLNRLPPAMLADWQFAQSNADSSDSATDFFEWHWRCDETERQNSRFLAHVNSHIALAVGKNKEKGCIIPFYLSVFREPLNNGETADSTVYSYPSLANVFDIFCNDWYDAIDDALAAGKALYQQSKAQAHDQALPHLVVRWAVDLSPFYSILKEQHDNNSSKILPANNRKISGKSMGAVFALAFASALAQADLRGGLRLDE